MNPLGYEMGLQRQNRKKTYLRHLSVFLAKKTLGCKDV
jgi:hypothetical protein